MARIIQAVGGGASATGLTETGGPTDLTMASVADGEYFVRSGTTIDGSATVVTGPASAVSGQAATYNGTSGKVIQDSGVILSGAASPWIASSADPDTGLRSSGANVLGVVCGGGTQVTFQAALTSLTGATHDIAIGRTAIIAGAIDHNGTTAGFYGATPTTQPTDVGALTDSTGGTANGTVQDVTGAHDQTILNNNFADLIDKINGIRTRLQALGLMA